MTKIEWVRGDDGSEGLSWNALRAERDIVRKGKTVTVSANHCEHVNEACRFCYSERGNPRLGGLPFKPGHRKDYRFVVNEAKLREPIRRRKPARVFVESTSDAFGEWWPRHFVDKLYAVMALCPHHLFINLSKRPVRRKEYLADPETPKRIARIAMMMAMENPKVLIPGGVTHFATYEQTPDGDNELTLSNWPLPNVVEGVSVSCQPEADEFVPELLATNCAIRAVSAEPLLDLVDLTHITREVISGAHVDNALDGFRSNGHGGVYGAKLDWVIGGFESGPAARVGMVDHARSLRDQCTASGTKFHWKQNGEWLPLGDVPALQLENPPARVVAVFPDGRVSEQLSPADLAGGPKPTLMARVGKAKAGRLLDGREHNDMPALPVLSRQDAAA